jgi:hypothetical protein
VGPSEIRVNLYCRTNGQQHSGADATIVEQWRNYTDFVSAWRSPHSARAVLRPRQLTATSFELRPAAIRSLAGANPQGRRCALSYAAGLERKSQVAVEIMLKSQHFRGATRV